MSGTWLNPTTIRCVLTAWGGGKLYIAGCCHAPLPTRSHCSPNSRRRTAPPHWPALALGPGPRPPATPGLCASTAHVYWRVSPGPAHPDMAAGATATLTTAAQGPVKLSRHEMFSMGSFTWKNVSCGALPQNVEQKALPRNALNEKLYLEMLEEESFTLKWLVQKALFGNV